MAVKFIARGSLSIILREIHPIRTPKYTPKSWG
jgi:hypothetical protein